MVTGSDAPPPTDPDGLRAYREERRTRIYNAAGVTPAELPVKAAQTVECLVGWDDATVEGIVALIETARTGPSTV